LIKMMLQTQPSKRYNRISRHRINLDAFRKNINRTESVRGSMIYGPVSHFDAKAILRYYNFNAIQSKRSILDSIQSSYDSVVTSLKPKYSNENSILSRVSPNVKITPSIPSVVKKRIQELERLADGWNSYSAKAINNEAIRMGISVLVQISSGLGSQLLDSVFIAPCSDGGIQLEWELDLKEFILKIEPDGQKMFYLLANPPKEEIEGIINSMTQLKTMLREFLIS